METKEERAAKAQKHIALMKGAFGGDIKRSAENVIVYEDGEGRTLPLPEELPAEATEIIVTTRFIPSAFAHEAKGKTVVVDPGSFTRPGGNYEGGVFGPEQAICADSDLYPILCSVRDIYYDQNKSYVCGQLFTDRALYVPDVVFSVNGSMKNADILVISEPLKKRALENHRSEKECDDALATRIETIFRIAAAQNAETLVMGAFGSGWAGYTTDQVIALMKAWLDANAGAIPRVVFAVPRAAQEAFEEAFGTTEAPVPAEAEGSGEDPEEEDAEDSSFVLDFDLPEGVTLR